jgi:hypothetical protein
MEHIINTLALLHPAVQIIMVTGQLVAIVYIIMFFLTIRLKR